MAVFSPDVGSEKSSPCVFKKGDMVIRLWRAYSLSQFFAVTQYLGCIALFLCDLNYFTHPKILGNDAMSWFISPFFENL